MAERENRTDVDTSVKPDWLDLPGKSAYWVCGGRMDRTVKDTLEGA